MKRPPLYFDTPLWKDSAPSMFRSLCALFKGPRTAKWRFDKADRKRLRLPRLRRAA